jgi:hypothetical protein
MIYQWPYYIGHVVNRVKLADYVNYVGDFTFSVYWPARWDPAVYLSIYLSTQHPEVPLSEMPYSHSERYLSLGIYQCVHFKLPILPFRTR